MLIYLIDVVFNRCSGLVDISHLVLPATELSDSCYAQMFSSCTGLKGASHLKLPATTLGKACYANMFDNYSSLQAAPVLPATSLAEYCYSGMFIYCVSLKVAHKLLATDLKNFCYKNMFFINHINKDKASLNKVYCAATTTDSNAFQDWLANAPSEGDIYLDESETIFQTDSASGIQAGWTRHSLSDWKD